MTDNNTYEVGFTPDDNNDIRLPGSVQPEPIMGAGAYDFAKPTGLDPKPTAGPVGVPYMDSGFGMEDDMAPQLNANVDVHNSDTSLNVTNSEENRSAQYKYPNKTQDVPEEGRKQFSDHT